MNIGFVLSTCRSGWIRYFNYNLKKLEISWFRVVHARSIEPDLILQLQIVEETACILVLGCPCVEHDQIFALLFVEGGNMLVSNCPFIQSRPVSILLCISAVVQ